MNRIFSSLPSMIAVAGALTFQTGTASANAFCDAQVTSYRGELEAKAAPVIAEIDKGIADIKAGGGNPDKVAFQMNDGSFKTLPQLRDSLVSQKVDVTKEIDDASAKCDRDLKPLQDLTDGAVTIATNGLNKLLPKRMTHIEIGEVLAGKPLGGDGALIPHFRDQILGALHIDTHSKGFVTSLIVDPINTILFRR